MAHAFPSAARGQSARRETPRRSTPATSQRYRLPRRTLPSPRAATRGGETKTKRIASAANRRAPTKLRPRSTSAVGYPPTATLVPLIARLQGRTLPLDFRHQPFFFRVILRHVSVRVGTGKPEFGLPEPM